MTLFKRLVMLCPSGAVISLGTLAFLLSSQEPGCSCLGPNAKAMRRLSSLNLAYQASHIEQDRFVDPTQMAQAVNIELEGSGGTHLYRSGVINRDLAISYAIPHDAYFYPRMGPFTGKRKPAYYGSVSAIAFNPDTRKYKSVVCRATEPSRQPLEAPTFNSGIWQCPANADEYSVN